METHTEKHPTQKDLWKRWDQNPPAQKTHCRLRDKRDRIFLGPPFEDDRGNCWSQPGLGLAVTNQSMNSLCRIDSRLTLNPHRPAALWAGHCEQIVGLDSTIVPGKRETTGSTNVEHVWQWIAKLGMVHISNPLNWDVRINKQFPHSCPDGNFAVAARSSVVLRAYTPAAATLQENVAILLLGYTDWTPVGISQVLTMEGVGHRPQATRTWCFFLKGNLKKNTKQNGQTSSEGSNFPSF